ncbi:heme NO-binding domain-containing protein [Synechococcus sp. Cruz-9H2]|nr:MULTISPECIES: heme NO-binding domain-containing protein [unclassified Synechococcus]MCP9862332.1 heme NO-binding domain-containing protein [Synechococcus sp. Cruz-7E5]MCP9818525.1 heme NO-binding domain-containing protein [Synechococcus sp. Cruz-9H2]MCP9842756.1 heme NO-binding domain-containing protein [Synechococcus sp. Edmonson 11F2]MCP9855421.1 heme NO-binding domain-containing protein [Synechococcus sp. Cruz-9C9]MCP9869604.1 heme NO-binding domain-containing protein [Synechococcus sp. 
MYGLVNRAIQQMVTSHHGDDVWRRIKEKADLEDLDFFSTFQAYPDDVTHRLVAAASEELGLSGDQIMQAFGEYWITYTASEGYEQLLESTGETLPEFLDHLDNLHARAGLSFPQLQPPSFRCEHAADQSMDLEYRSKRYGLAPMVIGLLHGLGKRFRTSVTVVQTASRDRGDARDLFHVRYSDLPLSSETNSEADSDGGIS